MCPAPLISEHYDDIYFSAEDGLAETHHVFLNGNNLPTAWQNRDHFTIFETGFGTGLNFLAAWDLFEKTAQPDQILNFISVEKHPLDHNTIREALSQWDFSDKIERMITHNLPNTINCIVHNGDVNTVLPRLNDTVDCWFLDGFTPAKNPDMWTDAVFQNMARMSNSDATFATFTAAGHVRRGLHNAGFTVHKIKGFGRKRDMLIGRITQ